MGDNFVWNSIRLWKCQKCYFYGVTTTSGLDALMTRHVTMENVMNRKFKVFEVEYEIFHELDRIFKNILKTKKSCLTRVKKNPHSTSKDRIFSTYLPIHNGPLRASASVPYSGTGWTPGGLGCWGIPCKDKDSCIYWCPYKRNIIVN